jgi:hypothetical protein
MGERGLAAPLVVAGLMLLAAPHARAGDEGMLWRGEFAKAREIAQADPSEAPRMPGYLQLEEAGRLLHARRFADARLQLSVAARTDDFGEVSMFWICRSYALEGRPDTADKCYLHAMMDPSDAGHQSLAENGPFKLASSARPLFMTCACKAACVYSPAAPVHCQIRQWTVEAPNDCSTNRPAD